MAKYYVKECPQTPIHFSIGRKVPFEDVDGDYGVYATDNGWEIGEIQNAILNRSGGITEITEAQYSELLKKKALAPPPSRSPRQRQSLGSPPRQSVQASLAGPAAGADVLGVNRSGNPVTGVVQPQKSEGLKVDREFVRPKAGKIPTPPPVK